MESRRHKPYEHRIECMTSLGAVEVVSPANGLKRVAQQYRPQSDETASSLPTNTASTLCDSAAFCSVLSPRATQPLRPVLIPSQHGYALDAGLEPSPSANASHPPAITFDVTTIHNFPVPKPRKAKQTNDNPYGLQQMETFVCKIPCNESDWQAKRKKFALSDGEGVLSVFADIMPLEPYVGIASTSKISDYILHRADEAKCVRHPLSDFGALVFVGECSVALQLGAGAKVVNEAMRSFWDMSQTKTGDSTLRKYLKVPARVTRLMERLYPGCRHRAFEMFVYSGMSVSKYDKLLTVGDTLYEKVCEKTQSTTTTASVEAETQAKFPFYLPFLIWAGFRLRLKVDCFDALREALKGELFTKSDFEKWIQFYIDRRPDADGFDERENAAPSRIASHDRPLPDEPMPKRRRMALDGGLTSTLPDYTAPVRHQGDAAQVDDHTLPVSGCRRGGSGPVLEDLVCSTNVGNAQADETGGKGVFDHTSAAVWMGYSNEIDQRGAAIADSGEDRSRLSAEGNELGAFGAVQIPLETVSADFGVLSGLSNGMFLGMDFPVVNQALFDLDGNRPVAISVAVGVDESPFHSDGIATGGGPGFGGAIGNTITDEIASVRRNFKG